MRKDVDDLHHWYHGQPQNWPDRAAAIRGCTSTIPIVVIDKGTAFPRHILGWAMLEMTWYALAAKAKWQDRKAEHEMSVLKKLIIDGIEVEVDPAMTLTRRPRSPALEIRAFATTNG